MKMFYVKKGNLADYYSYKESLKSLNCGDWSGLDPLLDVGQVSHLCHQRMNLNSYGLKLG